jgi:hypothetical protein
LIVNVLSTKTYHSHPFRRRLSHNEKFLRTVTERSAIRQRFVNVPLLPEPPLPEPLPPALLLPEPLPPELPLPPDTQQDES